MAVKVLGKFRGAAVLAAVSVAFLALAAFLAFEVYQAVDTGVLERRRADVAMAARPIPFWLGVGLRVAGAAVATAVAILTLRLGMKMHHKGLLFVAEDFRVRPKAPPLIDEAKKSTIDG